MDDLAEFERAFMQMDWADVLDTLQVLVGDFSGSAPHPPPVVPSRPQLDTYSRAHPHDQADMEWDDVNNTVKAPGDELFEFPPNPPSPLPAVPTQPELDSYGQTDPCDQAGLYGQADPYSQEGPYSQIEPYCQAGPNSQAELYGQAGPYSEAELYAQAGPYCQAGPNSQAELYGQAEPYSQGQCYAMPRKGLPQGFVQGLAPLELVNGKVVYVLPLDKLHLPAAPLTNYPNSQNWKRKSPEDQPYIKKPPNAFMLFRKEQRPNVVAELKTADSAPVNTLLGKRWKSLSQEEQAKYYEEAEREKLLHSKHFPGWSSRDNYGKKRTRIRRKS